MVIGKPITNTRILLKETPMSLLVLLTPVKSWTCLNQQLFIITLKPWETFGKNSKTNSLVVPEHENAGSKTCDLLLIIAVSGVYVNRGRRIQDSRYSGMSGMECTVVRDVPTFFPWQSKQRVTRDRITQPITPWRPSNHSIWRMIWGLKQKEKKKGANEIQSTEKIFYVCFVYVNHFAFSILSSKLKNERRSQYNPQMYSEL